MKYFSLETLADPSNEDYCFTDNAPKPIGAYYLKTGVRLEDEYPDELGHVTLALGEDYPGLELPSFIGNTDCLLIVSRSAAETIQSRAEAIIEVVPFKLINHKGRVHSEDYVFLNPIGTYDCLDMERTECKRFDDGEIMKITKLVLSTSKLAEAPHLLRPREAPSVYLFSEDLVHDLCDKEFTNFIFEEVEQSGA